MDTHMFLSGVKPEGPEPQKEIIHSYTTFPFLYLTLVAWSMVAMAMISSHNAGQPSRNWGWGSNGATIHLSEVIKNSLCKHFWEMTPPPAWILKQWARCRDGRLGQGVSVRDGLVTNHGLCCSAACVRMRPRMCQNNTQMNDVFIWILSWRLMWAWLKEAFA